MMCLIKKEENVSVNVTQLNLNALIAPDNVHRLFAPTVSLSYQLVYS